MGCLDAGMGESGLWHGVPVEALKTWHTFVFRKYLSYRLKNPYP